jgi:protein TonB
MAAPMVNKNGKQDANEADPALGLSPSQPVANTDALGGLGSKQPVAPGSSTFAPAPPASSAPGSNVGGDVKPAKLISSAPPVYPTLAKNQHVGGDVKVDALVDASGRVTAMKVISGPTLLHQAAMDALRQWKYQPATLDGKPVPMHVTVTLQFRLQ